MAERTINIVVDIAVDAVDAGEDAAYCYRRSSMVCLSVCLIVGQRL